MISKLLFLLGLSLPLTSLAQAPTERPLLPGESTLAMLPIAAQARSTSTVSQLQQILTQNYAASSWTDYSRSLYQRYRQPLLVGWIVSELKNGSTWDRQSRIRYQYRPTGDLLADTVDLLSAPSPIPYSAQVWTYDAQNRQALVWSQTRNATTSGWDSTSRAQYFYAGSSTQPSRILYQGYAARRYTNQTQALYSYTGAAQLQVLENQTWSPMTSAWGPSMRSTYSYDAQGRIQQLVYENVTAPATTYANYLRYTYQYGPNNRVSTLVLDLWQAGSWQPYSQLLYTYDTNGDPATVTTQTWTNGAYQNSSRSVYTYLLVSNSRAAQAAGIGLQVLPNPSQGAEARLTFQPQAGPLQATVRDAAGRIVATQAIAAPAAVAGEAALPSHLPPGFYLVELQAGESRWQVRWVRQ